VAQTACRRIAIWIDAQQAILCAFGVGPSDDPIPHGSGDEWSDHRVDARLYPQPQQYYEAVLSHLKCEDEILILGPGQAKRDLHQQLRRHGAQKNKVIGLRHAPRLAEVELVFPMGEEWGSVDMGPA
jgi:hypothetical protein